MKKRIIVFLFILFITTFFSFSQNSKYKILWIDNTANFKRIYNKDTLENILEKAKETGFNAVCFGIKPLSGEVIYKSSIAPQMTEWNNYKANTGFDVLKYAIKKSKQINLKIFGIFEVLVEGYKTLKRGPIYTHPHWQSYVYDTMDQKPQIIKICDWRYGLAAFVNPLIKEVRNYEYSLIREIFNNYELDGIVFDRARFNGINTDFSDTTRIEFISFLEKRYSDFVRSTLRFPEDIYEIKIENFKKKIIRGKYFKEWLLFRSEIIKNLFTELTGVVRSINPEIIIGDYVGSWYPVYYENGVNWASYKYSPEYEWALPDYKRTGYLETIDWLAVGCYYPQITIDEAVKSGKQYYESVEGACKISMDVSMNAKPVYSTLYVRDYKDNPEQFLKAIKMGLEKSNGIAIFDISQVIDYNWWQYLKIAFKNK